MRVLSVTYSVNSDQTKVKIAEEFLQYADGLLKSDVLGDVISLVNEILDQAKAQYIGELSAQTGRSVNDVRPPLRRTQVFLNSLIKPAPGGTRQVQQQQQGKW